MSKLVTPSVYPSLYITSVFQYLLSLVSAVWPGKVVMTADTVDTDNVRQQSGDSSSQSQSNTQHKNSVITLLYHCWYWGRIYYDLIDIAKKKY